MRPLGIVVGYCGEARCLSGADLRIACSGADPERARSAAERLGEQGVAGLVSFGLAGALASGLAPGALLLPESVRDPYGRWLPTDPEWRARLATRLEAAGLRATSGPLAGSEEIAATVDAKRALAAGTGAVAVDIESHRVAEAAASASLPFLVVRAIADRSNQSIPRVALNALDAQGEVRRLAVLGRLIGRPWEIGALISLGRASGEGLATLRRVATLAPDLGFL